MNDTTFPKWFWLVAGLALLWNLAGLGMFFQMMTMTPESMAQYYNAEKMELMKQTPSWVNIAFGLAVIAGTLGSILLLLRKNWAFPIFIISLLGVIGQQTYMHFLSNTFDVMGKQAMIMPGVVLLIALFLTWFSHRSSMQGWLK